VISADVGYGREEKSDYFLKDAIFAKDGIFSFALE